MYNLILQNVGRQKSTNKKKEKRKSPVTVPNHIANSHAVLSHLHFNSCPMYHFMDSFLSPMANLFDYLQLLTVAKNVNVNLLKEKFQCTSTIISLEEILRSRIFKTKHKCNYKGSCY